MKKILSLWLIISVFSFSGGSLTTIKNNTEEVINIIGKGTYTCILCGLDDAAGNTDSIIVSSYNSVENCISFIQIPRDSYYDFGTSQNKLNQLVPHYTSLGSSVKEGLVALKDNLSDSLAIDVDCYVAFNTASLENLIDLIGGVNIDVPFDISGNDLQGNTVNISAGMQKLSGKEALVLIRHRSSYPLGDLSRIDMQKLFLCSILNDFFEGLDFNLAMKLLGMKDDGILFNVNLVELLTFTMKNLGRIKNASLKFVTLPGAALFDSRGISYYCVNKIATERLISELKFKTFKGFDANEKFLYNFNSNFRNIYFDDNIKYTIYTNEDIQLMKFITN